LARTGAIASNQSGDFCIAFSTAQRIVQKPASQTCNLEFLCEADLTNFFQATIESTEEAVINALFAAEPIQLSDGLILTALPVDQVLKIMKMD
jgi:D-aminopeptidase